MPPKNGCRSRTRGCQGGRRVPLSYPKRAPAGVGRLAGGGRAGRIARRAGLFATRVCGYAASVEVEAVPASVPVPASASASGPASACSSTLASACWMPSMTEGGVKARHASHPAAAQDVQDAVGGDHVHGLKHLGEERVVLSLDAHAQVGGLGERANAGDAVVDRGEVAAGVGAAQHVVDRTGLKGGKGLVEVGEVLLGGLRAGARQGALGDGARLDAHGLAGKVGRSGLGARGGTREERHGVLGVGARHGGVRVVAGANAHDHVAGVVGVGEPGHGDKRAVHAQLVGQGVGHIDVEALVGRGEQQRRGLGGEQAHREGTGRVKLVCREGGGAGRAGCRLGLGHRGAVAHEGVEVYGARASRREAPRARLRTRGRAPPRRRLVLWVWVEARMGVFRPSRQPMVWVGRMVRPLRAKQVFRPADLVFDPTLAHRSLRRGRRGALDLKPSRPRDRMSLEYYGRCDLLLGRTMIVRARMPGLTWIPLASSTLD